MTEDVSLAVMPRYARSTKKSPDVSRCVLMTSSHAGSLTEDADADVRPERGDRAGIEQFTRHHARSPDKRAAV